MSADLARKAIAEAAGTAILVATVIGSGIMAEDQSAGNAGVALLGNTIATGAMLAVLITVFGPLSGAHFNPAVSFVFALRRALAWSSLPVYVAAQIAGGLLGTLWAHAMFDLPLIDPSLHERSAPGMLLGEFTATFMLVVTILAVLRHRSDFVPVAVALVITAGYWFTSSTSFANPAVTIARALSDTFAGIRPADVPAFIVVQIAGAFAAHVFFRRLFEAEGAPASVRQPAE